MISGLTWAVFHFSSPPPWAMAISWGTTSSVKWCKGSEEIYVIVSLLLTVQILLSKKIELSNKTHPCALPIALPIFGPPCLLRKYKSIFSDNTELKWRSPLPWPQTRSSWNPRHHRQARLVEPGGHLYMKATNFPFGQAFVSTNTYSDISNAKPSFGRRQHSVSLTFDQPPSLKS